MDQPGAPQALQGIVRQARLDVAAQLGEIAQRGFAKLQHALLHRQVAGVVAEPAEPGSAEVAPEVVGEPARIVAQRQRTARIVAGLGGQQPGQVGHAAPHRAFGGQLLDEQFRLRAVRHRPWDGRKP